MKIKLLEDLSHCGAKEGEIYDVIEVEGEKLWWKTPAGRKEFFLKSHTEYIELVLSTEEELERLKAEQKEQDKKIAELEKKLESEKEIRVPDSVDIIGRIARGKPEYDCLICGNELILYDGFNTTIRSGDWISSKGSNFRLVPVDKPEKGGLYYHSDESNPDFSKKFRYSKYYSDRCYFWGINGVLHTSEAEWKYNWKVVYEPK